MSASTGPVERTSFFASLPGVLTAVAAVITAVGGVYGVWWTSRPPTPLTAGVVATSPPPQEERTSAPPTTEPAHEPAPEATAAPEPAEPEGGELSADDVAALVGALLGGGDGDAAAGGAGETALLAWYSSASAEAQLALELCAVDDAASCEQVWYLLHDDCGLFDAAACDAIFWLSPLGSELETFGATCGGLVPDRSAAGECP